MKRREVKGAPSTDLLVCFPTRSHLTLMPKMICSPSRTSSKSDGGLWSRGNQIGPSEPTSPKVTCAGQIKVRSKSRSCKNWQSVMEQIERIHDRHNNNKHGKKPIWGETIGFKKESMQFLASLRSFKFDLGCFGAFPNANVTSDDEEDDVNHVEKLMRFGGYNDHDHGHDEDHDEGGSSRSAFSKWFTVLEQNQDQDCSLLEKEDIGKLKFDDEADQSPCVPPSNALLLMRSRSAPVQRLLEDEEGDNDDDDDDDDDDVDVNDDSDDNNYQHGDGKKSENLMELMKYEGDFYKLSCDIVKETWVVGGTYHNTCSRSQSSKRCSTECLEEVKACLRS
ncbi:uncharacterized protein [Rutidosis leptorrhynchoides]|uniref:uncharacterized protein n=1 Tax=Rutidosis leptorrhynchoides TaxID=125765 RepID=UPI003A99E31B